LAQETGIVADARELEAGKAWVFGSLLKWSGSLVESGDLHHREVVGLTEEFEKVIERKREDFFGFFHGNVIGDHLLLDAFRTPYLFGMRIVLRPGNGYYDFLRALDWLILKTPTHEKTFDDVVGWMRTYLLGEDWEEVKRRSEACLCSPVHWHIRVGYASSRRQGCGRFFLKKGSIIALYSAPILGAYFFIVGGSCASGTVFFFCFHGF
jgi:hypothetical protein